MTKNRVKIVLHLLPALFLALMMLWNYCVSTSEITANGMLLRMALMLLVQVSSALCLLYYSRIPFGLNTGLVLGGAFVLMLGASVRILHYPGANFLLSGGVLLLGISYIVRFVRKSRKGFGDVLKLLFIVNLLVLNGMYVLGPGPAYIFIWLSPVLLLSVLLWQMAEAIKEERTSTGEMRSSID
ncbi:MAG: hypothetical protein IBJ09_06030 [Bacteroidia bacterium]|nr:hypothetical protein [Bacteroidia bacterium]